MTERSIRLLDEVRQDLRAGKQFYDHLQPGVGGWFRDALLADIESLHVYAGIHAQQFGYYRMLAKRFPYAVYYGLDPRFITIMAVLPMRRDPNWIASLFQRRTTRSEVDH